jgi:hypothetical protein
MDVAARSIVSDATNLREVAAALRALLASKGDGADRAFATNLEEIALEIDAAVARGATGRDSRSLCVTARRSRWDVRVDEWVRRCRSLCVTARRVRWLAWSGDGDAPTTAALLRLATEMEEGAERLTVAARNPLPAVAMLLALAIAAWGLFSPFLPWTAETEKAVPAPPPAPTIMAAPIQPEPEPPIAQAVQPEIAALPRPTARVAPLAVAESKSIGKSEATTPKPRRVERPATPDEARALTEPFLDTVGSGTNVQSPAPPAAPASARQAPAPAAEAPAPTIEAAGVDAVAPVPLGATVPPDPRDCVPYLAKTTLDGRSQSVSGLACRDAQGQWRRVSETLRQ